MCHVVFIDTLQKNHTNITESLKWKNHVLHHHYHQTQELCIEIT